MKRSVFLPLALVFLVASCEDEPSKPSSIPTAPVPPVIGVQAANAVAASNGGSTICRAYTFDRDRAQAQLDSMPSDSLVLRRVKRYDALVKETCS